jgi:carbon-monoxide dehydrogenase catalytic subunit
VVGSVNPRVKQDWVYVELVKELIKNDVLVVQTGCSQISLTKAICARLKRPIWPGAQGSL